MKPPIWNLELPLGAGERLVGWGGFLREGSPKGIGQGCRRNGGQAVPRFVPSPEGWGKT
jgi:hypothetical protein